MSFWWLDHPHEITFPASVERWRLYAERFAGGVPVEFILAWMAHESSGKLSAVSKLGERGLFQIHPEGEREQLKLSDDTWDKILVDPNVAMATGVKLITTYSNRAAKLLAEAGLDWDRRSFWSLTKLFHAATAMPKYSFAAFARHNGRSPSGFQVLARWSMQAPKNALADDPAFSSRLSSLAQKVFPSSAKVGGVVH